MTLAAVHAGPLKRGNGGGEYERAAVDPKRRVTELRGDAALSMAEFTVFDERGGSLGALDMACPGCNGNTFVAAVRVPSSTLRLICATCERGTVSILIAQAGTVTATVPGRTD